MFVWRVDVLLAEIQRLVPELHAGLMRICDRWDVADRDRVVAEVWAELAETTIDQGIMERAAQVAATPAEIGWSDVGDWHGLGELIAQDAIGNAVNADLVQIESQDCVVWSGTGRLVALIGQEHTVVVDTQDALLVIDRRRAQDVKRIVDELKRRDRREVR